MQILPHHLDMQAMHEYVYLHTRLCKVIHVWIYLSTYFLMYGYIVNS
jgi:hypothetical protein